MLNLALQARSATTERRRQQLLGDAAQRARDVVSDSVPLLLPVYRGSRGREVVSRRVLSFDVVSVPIGVFRRRATEAAQRYSVLQRISEQSLPSAVTLGDEVDLFARRFPPPQSDAASAPAPLRTAADRPTPGTRRPRARGR